MSNKLKKKITCVFCEKTVPYTSDCQELFGRDVCPDCAGKVAEVVNKMVSENGEAESGEKED